MTEYDYSPAAYERHLANQARVSNWVYGQANHAAQYASPFVPHPASASSSSCDSPLDDHDHRDRYDRYGQRRDYGRGRPSPSRPSEPSGRPHMKRPTTSPPPQQSYRSSRSSSQPRSPTHLQPPSQHPRTREVHLPPLPARTRAHEQPHHPQYPQYAAEAYLPPSASGQRTYKTFTIDPSNTREIVLPPPRRGETYVIIPPAGQQIEVVHGSSSGGSQSASRSPTKRNNPPLIKRLFGAVGPSSSRTTSQRERTSSY